MRPALLLILPCSLLLITPLAAQTAKQAAPRVSMKRWISTTVNGSADAAGKNALVVRSRNIVLLSHITPGKKPTERIIARPKEGSSMGYGWISPDGLHGAIMDDAQVLSIVALAGGKTKQLTRRYAANHARFSPDSAAALWWRLESPADRSRHAQHAAQAEIVPACTLYRLELGGAHQPVKTTLPSCRNILHVSPDGRYAVVGDGGQQRSLKAYTETLYEGQPYALDIRTDSYERFYRVTLATGQAELLGQHELLGTSSSDDGRVVCGSEPAAFQATGPARVVCLRDGQAHTYTAPAADDPARGWRTLSVSPDGSKLAMGLQAGPLSKQRGVVHVLALDGSRGAMLLSEPRRASTLAWLPGGRRLFMTPDNAPAMLHDLEAGWSVKIGEPGQEVSGLIPLGAQDERFLVGVERKNTRDMWMIELSAPGAKKSP
jgi:hypothetical protein